MPHPVLENIPRFTIAAFKEVFKIAHHRQDDNPIECDYTLEDIEYYMVAEVKQHQVASILFKWSKDGSDYQQKVDIVYLPSNLGKDKGNVPYFQCPYTKNLCKILYAPGKYILGRGAFYNTYETCNHTPKQRETDKYFKLMVYDQRRKYYNGKLTRFGRRVERLEQELKDCKDKSIEDRMYQRKLQKQIQQLRQRGVK